MVERDGFLDAQHSVLGAMLLDEACIAPVMSAVSVSDFRDDKCALVFSAMRKLFSQAQGIDPVVVAHLLDGMGESLRPFLMQLMDTTPTTSNVMAYVDLLKRGARLASMQDLAAQIYACHSLDEASALLDQANALFCERGKLRRMNMEDMLVDFHERHTQAHQYLTWGLPALDRQIFAERGDFLVLGGYPSSGKTALAVSFAYHMAQDMRVGFYSLETSAYKLADRLVSHLTKLSMGTIKQGDFTQEQWSQVLDHHADIPKRRLELIEAGGLSAAEIRADAIAHHFEFIVVDYLQLISGDARGTRAEEVAQVSRALHTMSQRDKITVLALSQLARPERNGGKPSAPTMRDLRESGQIEQDADCVMLLYEADTQQASERYLKLAKNKEGERGRILLDFDGTTQSFQQVVQTTSIAKEFSDKGRAIKATRHLTHPLKPLTQFALLEGDDPNLPFEAGGACV